MMEMSWGCAEISQLIKIVKYINKLALCSSADSDILCQSCVMKIGG